MLFVVVVLDARYKMNYLKVKYTSIFGEDEATKLIKRVTRCLNEMMENYKKNEKHLERYLEEYPEKFTIEFDILSWWKVNSSRFPILSMVAKDVLAIQASSVASESAFSTGGRTLDKFRSSLTSTTNEILICCQDWLRSSKLPISVEELILSVLDKAWIVNQVSFILCISVYL
ncbi:hypothetical protein DCAR_0727363 [Daucus carota subsp. sativus]|uniref:HAT C-terminal dimerisation domain-containing protein n=1 Tax=Daucus carota subsp. sativus TaxID=79200 RepID=A0AAF1B7W7_DAUCS|nr:hypothetical protein DCAR_0727363 [Daucus carota subsp. sativus]